MIHTPNCFERPDWWEDFVNKPVIGSKSKLWWTLVSIWW